MTSAALSDDVAIPASSTRAIVAACVGNMLEWYDFIVYSTFAVQISLAFFPGKDQFISLLATLVTFGASGFLAWLAGAALIGCLCRQGRSARRARTGPS